MSSNSLNCQTVKTGILAVAGLLVFGATVGSYAKGEIILSQYYENSSEERFLEFANVGSTTVSFDGSSGLFLGIWENANTEAYKTNAVPDRSASFDHFFSGQTLAPGEVLVTDVTPIGVCTICGLIDFAMDGNDSLAIYRDAVGAIEIEDAIGFTELGAEGANTSWVRMQANPGYDTIAGSNVTDFSPPVWRQVATDDVDTASDGDALGASVFVANVPEPGSAVLIVSAALVGLVRRRRQVG